MTRKHVLDGVKVLDFSHFIAGPHCTRLMAEAGAEVIKVEAHTGDSARHLPIIREGRSGYFIQHNRGKKNLCLDLRTAEGQEICHELIKTVDVVIENFTPGVMKKFNMDWDAVSKINPDVIMCSISCLGQEGPLAKLPGFDYIGQAYSGLLGMTGQADGYPALSGMAFGDVSTGAHAYGAIVTALYHKAMGGGGQFLDIALLDCLFSFHEMNVQVYDASGGTQVPKRSGHQHAFVSPLGLFKCKENYIIIVAIGAQWNNLIKLLGREEWADEPRFANPLVRNENRDEISAEIERWLSTVSDVTEAVRILVQENHVPAAPVLSVPDVMAHPHMQQRGIVQTVDDRIFGEVKIPGAPLRYSQYPERLELQAPFLGEHNEEILREKLGYSAEKISALQASGVLSEKNI
ncbi:MAG: CaiB/BaiF CoA-transferase family protein [Porticoccaceae bacterium]|nr:CaiB/BaiF CoA-transferase family protein [Porticoccaceae bacterium]